MRTGKPRARCPGARPAARPARVPPVPQATATASAAPRVPGPAPRSRARRARCCRPPGRRTRPRGRAPGSSARTAGSFFARYVARSTNSRRIPSAAHRAREGLSGRPASSSPRTTPTVGKPSRRPAAAVARRWLEYAPPKVSTGRPAAASRLSASLRHLLPGRSGWMRSSRFRSSARPRRAKRSSSTGSRGEGIRGRSRERSNGFTGPLCRPEPQHPAPAPEKPDSRTAPAPRTPRPLRTAPPLPVPAAPATASVRRSAPAWRPS